MTVDDMTKDNMAQDPSQPENIVPAESVDQSQADVSGEVQSELDSLRDELDQARDRALRAQADFDNYQKRMSREVQESQRYAKVNVVRDLLPVLDNMQRALEAAQQAGESGSLLQGVQMVSQQMFDVLTQHGLQQIAAEGEAFDPDRHEAVSQQPTSDAAPGTVLHVVQVGYQLGDRVVRPAKVIVAQAPAQ